MASKELENVIETTEYDGVQLAEYNGKYSINGIQKGQNDVYYLKWIFCSKWSKGEGGFVPDDKKRPMHVVLGDKKMAIATLTLLLKELEAPF